MIDWENITKSDCILCILRDKETKKSKEVRMNTSQARIS